MTELQPADIDGISGGETQTQRETIGTAIILGGLATGDPIVVLLGVIYLNTN
nr:hypothetical protein [uncultured Sphingomonas sp.]